MILRITIWNLFWILASAQYCAGVFKSEKIYLKNVNLKDGISQCVTTDIIQDYKGFNWIGTYDGLNRYDGQYVKVYRHDPNDSSSLPSSKIYRVTCDDKNHVYMITAVGFSIFDCSAEKCVKPASFKTLNPSWLCYKSAGQMWLYDKKMGLMILNAKTFEVTQVSQAKNNLLKGVMLDIFDTDTKVLITSQEGEVLIYDKRTQLFSYHIPVDFQGLYNGVGLDKYGNIIFGSNETDILSFNVMSKTFDRSILTEKNNRLVAVTDIVYDNKENILFLSTYGQGLFVYEYASGQLTQFKKNDAKLNLSSNYLTALSLSKNNTLTIGYDGMGIDILDPHVRQFIPIKKEDPDDLKSLKFVRKIIEGDNNKIFMGTSGSGLVVYDRNDQSFAFFNMKNKLALTDNFIIEMARSNSDLWLGTNGNGVVVVDINTIDSKKIYEVGDQSNQLSDGTIWSFLDDHNGHMWVGTRENGLNKIDLKTNEIKQFTKDQYPFFKENGLRCMYRLNNKTILIGSEKGMFSLDLVTEKIELLFPKKLVDKTFGSIKCITTDKQNRIWLGTDGSGIVVLNPQYNLVKNFNASNYLNNSVIYSLLPENDTTFWISSNAGLSKIVWNEKSIGPNGTIQVSNYDETNGLQSNEFNTGAYAILSDGSMAFGGLNGINIFKPEEINLNKISPKVYIKEFKVFENTYYKGTNVAYLDNLDLKHFENSISISFNSIGSIMPSKIKYQYRLLGHENQWILADNRNYISYTNLASGNYEFQVKACNYDGVWSDEFTSLKIHIATPFYRTWWFILLVLGTLSYIGYSIYRFRMKQIKEKEELRIQYNKELAEVEMKALRAQINPHFLFNTLNSINNYILKNDTKKASRYLVKFSQLVRNILNNSSNPFITLQEELHTIELYMLIEGMRFNEQFSYNIENKNEINTANIVIPSLLLQPYVENAIWHGLLHKEGDKHIVISVEADGIDDSILINIIDNGVGRKMAEEIEQKPKHRKSYGMQLGENRLKLMNQNNGANAKVEVIDLVDDKHEPLGTQIKIILPPSFYQNNNNHKN